MQTREPHESGSVRRASSRLLLAPLLLGLALTLGGGRPAAAVEGAAILYGLDRPSEEEFGRLLSTDSVRYVCTQQIFTRKGVPPLARERAAKLAKAGKRIVLQIWWGPAGDFPWSKYGFANISLDEKVRPDFFREVVDACIEQYGVQNLYGVHLLEETGMQFGTDVDRRSDPDDFFTYEEDGNSYTAPFWSGYGKLPGGVHIPNVRRHEADFTRMTGLRFADFDKWGVLERHLFARWVAVRLQTGGQVEFAKHIRRKYPRLKAFTWDLLLAGGENPRTDFHLTAQHFDGLICDIYHDIGFNFLYQRAYRILCPKLEMIHFAMGGMGAEAGHPYATPDRKRALTLGAYLAGADVVGFFEHPHDFSRPESWKTNVDILGRLKPLPPFRKRPPVLLIANSFSNIYSCTYAWTGLKYSDVLPTWEAHDVDLGRYQVVILHVDGPGQDARVFWDAAALKERYGLPGHLDHRAFERFVAGGGTLILSGQVRLGADNPLFLAREGILRTEGGGNVSTDPFVVAPQGWLKEKLGLAREYRFNTHCIPVVPDKERVTATPAGFFAHYGKGAVFFAPYNRTYDRKEPYDSPMWQDYRQLLTDVARGVLTLVGKGRIAQEYLADPAVGNHYLQATSDDGRLAGCILLSPKQMRKSPWQLPGTDLLTGAAKVALDEQTTSALTRR